MAALESIEQASKLFPGAAIVNKFEDITYNRVGYTVVSKLVPDPSSDSYPLKNAVFSMIKAAFEAIDLQLHCGTHPRLGVVHHVCFHPLALISPEQMAGIAKSLADDIGCNLRVPTLYGAAHEEGWKLDSIQRALRYFKPNANRNQWRGLRSGPLPLKPDKGPDQVTESKGFIVIGATQWLHNYNVPVFSSDIAAVRRVAKQVSAVGGGLPGIQAMALTHGENMTEVACNLLEPYVVGGDRVQLEVDRLAMAEGMAVGKGYFTDISQQEIIENYLEMCSDV